MKLLLRADARRIPLAGRSVHCVVTSPPYFGLRDYGMDGQIGLEPTPAAYVATMVDVFREVRRVLRDDGTLWLNLGDSYSTSPRGNKKPGGGNLTNSNIGSPVEDARFHGNRALDKSRIPGLKTKDLIGIPWRVAFALQADGWYLRSDIIWHKPNPMPESVQDRPTKAHEYFFLLAKSEAYYYDAGAVREDAVKGAGGSRNSNKRDRTLGNSNGLGASTLGTISVEAGRNRRSVWTVATRPYSGAHFATMPAKLVMPCIRAGCPAGGIVFDPFGGAMTTVLAAEALGRVGIATELSPEYLRIGVRRIERPHVVVPKRRPEEDGMPLFQNKV